MKKLLIILTFLTFASYAEDLKFIKICDQYINAEDVKSLRVLSRGDFEVSFRASGKQDYSPVIYTNCKDKKEFEKYLPVVEKYFNTLN